MTVYCPSCGKPNTDQASNCASCGAQIKKPKAARGRFKGTMMMGAAPIPSPPAQGGPGGAAQNQTGQATGEAGRDIGFQKTLLGPAQGGEQPPASGGFGGSGGGFGEQPPASGGGFGGSSGGFGEQPPASGGGFGGSGGGFGEQPPASSPPSASSPAPGGFGGSGGGFGGPSGGFGEQPPASSGGFGGPSGGFGEQPPASSGGFGGSGGGFGEQPPASGGGFGGSGGGFGEQPPASGGGFGGSGGGFGEQPPPGSPPPKKNKTLLWVGLGCAALIVLGCLFFGVISCLKVKEGYQEAREAAEAAQTLPLEGVDSPQGEAPSSRSGSSTNEDLDDSPVLARNAFVFRAIAIHASCQANEGKAPAEQLVVSTMPPQQRTYLCKHAKTFVESLSTPGWESLRLSQADDGYLQAVKRADMDPSRCFVLRRHEAFASFCHARGKHWPLVEVGGLETL